MGEEYRKRVKKSFVKIGMLGAKNVNEELISAFLKICLIKDARVRAFVYTCMLSVSMENRLT